MNDPELQKLKNKLAKAAGYMILCEDPAYHSFWVKPNGDMVGPKDQDTETIKLIESFAGELQPFQHDILKGLLDKGGKN